MKEWKGRFEAMSTEKKYTEEEMKAIVAEEIRNRYSEYDINELEGVSGGAEDTTDQDVEIAWNIAKKYNPDVAAFYLAARGQSINPQTNLGDNIEHVLRYKRERQNGGSFKDL